MSTTFTQVTTNTNQLKLSAIAKTTITTTSTIIPTIFSIILPTNLVKLVLIPRGNIYINIGTAGTDTQLITTTIVLDVNKTIADTIELYANDIICDILIFIPRS
jgi:hypothetical protein